MALVIGLALLSPITNIVQDMTTTLSKENETVSLSTVRADDTLDINEEIGLELTESNPLSISEVRLENLTVLVQDTDYELIATRIHYLNSSTMISYEQSNETQVDYVYAADSYVDNSATRGFIPLIVLFFVLALLAAAIGGVFGPGARDKLRGFMGM